MLDVHAISSFLTEVCEHYEKSAPTVRDWADDLYMRIGEAPERVSLLELGQALRLRQEGEWCPPNLAANEVYHVQERLGQSTTGHAGF